MTPARTGIIPARAGFTKRIYPSTLPTPDHPRSRGVYSPSRRFLEHVGGSSPLARGLPENRKKNAVSLRIIPARAGFTLR